MISIIGHVAFSVLGVLFAAALINAAYCLVRYGVLPLSSRKKVYQQLTSEALFPYFEGKTSICDLGSGDGKLLIKLCEHYELTGAGFETQFSAYLLSRLRCWLTHSDVQFYWQSFYQADFTGVDIAYCFLMDDLMPKVASEVLPKLTPGTVLISNSFPLPRPYTADTTIEGSRYGLTTLYIYRV